MPESVRRLAAYQWLAFAPRARRERNHANPADHCLVRVYLVSIPFNSCPSGVMLKAVIVK